MTQRENNQVPNTANLATVITQEDQPKEKISDAEKKAHQAKEALRQSNIQNLANSLFDLNLLAQEQILNGLSNRECVLLQQIKDRINTYIFELGLFNCFIVYTKIKSNLFIDFQPPEIRLSFTPATIKKANDDVDQIEQSNIKNGLLIEQVNGILSKNIEISKKTIFDLHRENTSKANGFLITLQFDQFRNIPLDEVIDKLNKFSLDAQYSSPNELVVTQQFSDFFQIQQASPYTLSQQKFQRKNTIYIAFHNTLVDAPYRFLLTVLSKLMLDIEQKIKRNASSRNIQIKQKYDLIHETTALVNLDISYTIEKESK